MCNIKISFIVPVYNVEKYLNQCIESILSQSINSKEIILINDGSTDRSGVICDEYDRKYDFIRVIHKKNEGVSKARNMGIDYAKGEYIFFIDSDDFLLQDNVVDMYNECIKSNLDIIRGIYYRYNNEKKELILTDNYEEDYFNKVLPGLDFLKEEIKSEQYEVVPWLGLFRRKYIVENNLKFTVDVTYEDHEFFLKCLLCEKENKIMRKKLFIYAYRTTIGSITKTPKIKNIKDILKNINLMTCHINTLNLMEEDRCIVMKTVSTLFYQLTSIYGRLANEDKKEAYKLIPKNIKKDMIKYAFNTYQKTKIIMFFYFRNVVDIIYKIKMNK